MKKRIWVVGGSIGAVALLVLAMFPTIVGAQTVKPNESQVNIFQHIKNKIADRLWIPGELLAILFDILISFILWISVNWPFPPIFPHP
jgi:hypothetical protein